MKKNFLKKQDFLLKILSLALSIVLWAVVMDVDNPERNMRFDDVPVRIIGASQLKAATGLELIEGEDTTVTVSLRGQSKSVGEVRASQKHAKHGCTCAEYERQSDRDGEQHQHNQQQRTDTAPAALLFYRLCMRYSGQFAVVRQDLRRNLCRLAEFLDGLRLVFRACVIKIFFVIAQSVRAFLLRQNRKRTPQRCHVICSVHSFTPPKKIVSIPLR